MIHRKPYVPYSLLIAVITTSTLFASTTAFAFPQTFNAWQERYSDFSNSAFNAGCQLCHVNGNGGNPWNAYGWSIREALDDDSCDTNSNSVISNEEAFFCVELNNADNDGSDYENLTEIGLSKQPGWTAGPFNTYFSNAGTSDGNLPPDNIGDLDPDGTEPPVVDPPDPPDDSPQLEPGQIQRGRIIVNPGQSIQTAIDAATPGMTIFINPGVYREIQNPINGLTITKNNIIITGRRAPSGQGVIVENAGDQRNGIVVVPDDRTRCMSCHTDLAPPFPVFEGVPMGLKMRDPMMTNFQIRNVTIRNFRNNGLFTENVDGFKIINVESVNNRNYGIFPTLSKNGLIAYSKAIGSDLDSGIWVETSENVIVRDNVASGNVNGFEVSNSDDILLENNEAYDNTVGAAILLLPDIFDDRPGSKRIDLKNNYFHDNNKPNTARPGSVLSFIPAGIGVLYLGVDDSVVANNVIENNNFVGIVVSDYCLTVTGTPFDCFSGTDPSITPKFLDDQGATNNMFIDNIVINNGLNPDPDHPFSFAASDLGMLSINPSNCFGKNVYLTEFSLIGVLPPCP